MPGSTSKLLEKLFNPADGTFSPELSRHILSVRMTTDELGRYEQLSDLAQLGQLTGDQEAELDELLAVNDVLSVLHAKAKSSLESKPVA